MRCAVEEIRERLASYDRGGFDQVILHPVASGAAGVDRQVTSGATGYSRRTRNRLWRSRDVPTAPDSPFRDAEVLVGGGVSRDMGDLVDAVEGIVHEPTQVRDDGGIDLTVTEIYRIREPGRVDFGGGELEPADREPHERVWRDEDDDYRWWHLGAGTYLVEYNESLSGDAFLQPRTEIVERGASHPTLRVEELPHVPLTVGGGGLRLKENARVSALLPP